MDNYIDLQPKRTKNIFKVLWSNFAPYWPIFLLFTGLAVAGGWLYLKVAKPQYEATAMVLLKDEKKGIDDSKMIESLNLISTKKIVENEIEVIKSRSLMSEVVSDMKLYALISSEGNWRDISAYQSAPFSVEVKNPENLTEEKKIKVTFASDQRGILVDKARHSFGEWIKVGLTTFRIEPDTLKAHANGNFMVTFNNPKKVVERLMKKLVVEPSSKLSTVISLSIRNEDPALAKDVLNNLLASYTKAAISDKNSLASNTLKFVQDRLDIVSGQLDSIERSIQQYKATKGAVDISSQSKLFLENVSANDQKLSEVNMQLSVLNQVERYVQSKDLTGGIVPSTLGISDPLLTDLLNKLYTAELEKEKLSKTAAENSQSMIAINSQISKMRPSIMENIQSQRRSLEANRSNISSTNSAYGALLQTIPQKERDLVEISRQQSIESGVYSFLLQKREEAELSNASVVADNRVVDKAEASLQPVSPKKLLVYGIALFAALAISSGLVFGRELLSSNILYRTEIEQLTKIPIIGEIAQDSSKTPVVIAAGTHSLISQQFRKIRAALRTGSLAASKKRILITSSVPGEGKSFVSLNLGITMALAGKKVVLVEADLANPSLSKKIGVTPDLGLKDFLEGNATMSDIIVPSGVHDNLYIVSSGQIPDDPSELLLSEKMKYLLDQLHQDFDYVLVDSAPVGALADAYELAPNCELVLYVVRHGHTPKAVLERLDSLSGVSELHNSVIVFNGVKMRGFSKDSYGHGYGYDYIYSGRKYRQYQLMK